MKKLLLAPVIVLLIISAYVGVERHAASKQQSRPVSTEPEALWAYRCIDTMKTSRDKARVWRESPDLAEHVESQMKTIVDLGGNCVALDTPYDAEFLPYLKKWVVSAREHGLHVWFRGNFSSWEGWFEYPKGMTTADHIRQTNEFITQNSDLFEDGDIFTPSPEAENGGPFNQVETDEHEVFRKYLIAEHGKAHEAFELIGKDVRTNWLSMNGGLARRMFDQETIDNLDRAVSLDHYVKTPQEMGEYIRYFAENFGSRVVIGEWGAPIPQINGDMTESEQAVFIEALLWEMYVHRKHIDGINYWVLYDSSTALLEPDGEYRDAIDEMKDYFHPGEIRGTVMDIFEEPLDGASVQLARGGEGVLVQSDGTFHLPVPAGEHEIVVSHSGHAEQRRRVTIARDEIVYQDVVLTPARYSIWDKIRLKIRSF